MIFGLALFGCGCGFLADYQYLSIYIIKHLLLYFGIGIIFMTVELVGEVKIGFKLIFTLLFKLLILPLKMARKHHLIKKIEKKVALGAPLSDHELKVGQQQGDK